MNPKWSAAPVSTTGIAWKGLADERKNRNCSGITNRGHHMTGSIDDGDRPVVYALDPVGHA